MSEPTTNKNRVKKNSWFELRTVEDEISRDILSAVCVKYFSILMGALFAIVLAKPEIVSGMLVLGVISLRSTVYWYLLIGIFGLFGYEGLAMVAKNAILRIKIPFIFIALFGFYVTLGLFLFLTLFGRLLGIDD